MPTAQDVFMHLFANITYKPKNFITPVPATPMAQDRVFKRSYSWAMPRAARVKQSLYPCSGCKLWQLSFKQPTKLEVCVLVVKLR